MLITMIYAECRGVIAINGDLPVHLPEDLKFFKEFTMDKVLVMGRKTVESLPGKLEGRTVICLTTDPHYTHENCDYTLTSKEDIYNWCVVGDVEELIIAGGGQVYDEFLMDADRVVKTRTNHTMIPKKEFERAKGKVYSPDLREKGEFSSADVVEKTSKMVVVDFRWDGDCVKEAV